MPKEKVQTKSKPIKKGSKKRSKNKPKEKSWLTRDIKMSDLPEIYRLLSVEFPKNAIVKGRLWYGLDTEGPRGQSVINRLNEVLGINHWHYEYNIEDEKRGSMWTTACGLTLMIGNWKLIYELARSIFVPLASRSWIGGVSHLSRSEARKGAITNSLKKCAAAFGVAKEIYERLNEPEFEEQQEKNEEDVGANFKTDGGFKIEKTKPVNEHPLEVKEKGDSYAELLTELNSVQDKETLAKAQDMMDKIKGQLTSEQLVEAIKLFANLKKKYN